MARLSVHRERHAVVEMTAGSVCNVCGTRRDLSEPTEYRKVPGMHNITVEGGYGDIYPPDDQWIEFAVCAPCLLAWVNQFKVGVELRPRGRVWPAHVFDSETGEMLVLEAGWVRPPGTAVPTWDPALDEMYDGVARGVYEHFKGLHYYVYANAIHAVTRKPMVAYVGLYADSRATVRSLEMWDEHVERDGYSGPRFRFLHEA